MKINVVRSTVIKAPIDRVWGVLRDFNSHCHWHPAIVDSRMENDLDGDVVGGVRRFSFADGDELREQLLHHSDRNHTMAYSILDSSLPLVEYVATIHLKPVTDGNQTFWNWRAQFRTSDNRASELEHLVSRQVFEAGFTGLRTFLSEQAESSKKMTVRPEAPAVDVTAGQALQSKSVVAGPAGSPEALVFTDVTVPAPTPRQVRIRQTAISVNSHDFKYQGQVARREGGQLTPGIEGVGEIIDVGAQVNGFFPGDRVAYISRSAGAYCLSRCVSADACVPIPDGISDLNASMLFKGVTAALLLGHVFKAVAGATVFIQEVCGDLGHILCQWAKSMDLVVIGTVPSITSAKFIRDQGCDHPIIDSGKKPLAGEVMRITNGRGVDYWVHGSGASGIQDALACLARFGHCAIVGDREETAMPVDLNQLRQRSLSVSAPVCFDFAEDRLYLQRLSHHLFTKILNRDIIPSIDTFPLSQAAAVHDRIHSQKTMGALVLIPEG